jgi:hypothetical protein
MSAADATAADVSRRKLFVARKCRIRGLSGVRSSRVEDWLDAAGETGDVAGRIRMLQREHGLGQADAAAVVMFGNTR